VADRGRHPVECARAVQLRGPAAVVRDAGEPVGARAADALEDERGAVLTRGAQDRRTRVAAVAERLHARRAQLVQERRRRGDRVGRGVGAGSGGRAPELGHVPGPIGAQVPAPAIGSAGRPPLEAQRDAGGPLLSVPGEHLPRPGSGEVRRDRRGAVDAPAARLVARVQDRVRRQARADVRPLAGPDGLLQDVDERAGHGWATVEASH